MYENLFIQSSIDRHSDCFQFWDTGNKTSMNTLVKRNFLYKSVFISSEKVPMCEIAQSWVCS